MDNLKLRAEIRKLNEESDSTRQSRATILGLEASAKTVQQQLDDANNEVCQLRRELIQAQDHHDTEEAKENILGLENAHKAECQKLCSLIAVLREVIKKNKERNGASDGAQQKLGQEASHTFPSEQKKAISADNTDDAVASQKRRRQPMQTVQKLLGRLLINFFSLRQRRLILQPTKVKRRWPIQSMQTLLAILRHISGRLLSVQRRRLSLPPM